MSSLECPAVAQALAYNEHLLWVSVRCQANVAPSAFHGSQPLNPGHVIITSGIQTHLAVPANYSDRCLVITRDLVNFIIVTLTASTFTLEFCMGAGAVKSRGKTAGVPQEREERPPFIPWECRERDCLLWESCGTRSKGHFPPAGAGVTRSSLVGL